MIYPNPHAPSCPWYPVTERVGAPNIKWCEETLCQWVSEPANTWSNLGYMIIAVVIMYLANKNNQNSKLRQFGPIVFFMGAMSFFYHQSNFYLSQILDFIGMFLFVGWCKGMNLIRLKKLNEKNLFKFNLFVAVILCAVLHFMYVSGIKFQMLVLISGIIVVVTETMAQKQKRVGFGWLVASIGLLIIAFSFSVIDGKKIWCDPTQHGWLSQGHAIWHWVASMAMFTIYKHYSQNKLQSDP
jgi:hypothetical protein